MNGTFDSRRRPIDPATWTTVVIPAFNEAKRIGLTLNSWLEFAETSGQDISILVVSDGSSDATCDVVQEIAVHHPCVRLLKLDHRGKGAALRAGVAAASGRYICLADADLPTDPALLNAFVSILRDSPADIAIAVRSQEFPPMNLPVTRAVASAIFRWLVRTVVLPEIRDSQCGFKVLDRLAFPLLAETLTIDGFALDVELLRVALDAHLRLVEVPVQIVHRPGSTVHLWRDSIVMSRDIVRIAVVSRVRRLFAWGMG